MVPPTRSQEKLATETYYGFHPQKPAPVAQLAQIAWRLKESTSSGGQFIVANAQLELAMHPKLNRKERQVYATSAADSLTKQKSDGTSRITSPEAVPTLSHVAVYKYGWSEPTRRFTRSIISDVIASSEATMKHRERSDNGREKGALYRLAALMAIGHTNTPGLVALPSLARHANNQHMIDGKRYLSDITAYSDGSHVAPGTYHLRVTAPTLRNTQLHPDIITVDTAQVLGVDPRNPQQLYSLSRSLAGIESEADTPEHIRAIRDAMLTKMDQVGPSSPIMSPFAA